MIKKILKYTFIITISMFVACLLFIFTISGITIGMLYPQNSSVTLQDNTVLEIPINGLLNERTAENSVMSLLGTDDISSNSLENILAAIKEAQENASVKAIYLRGGFFQASPAAAEEIRQALSTFKQSGKPIIAYADAYSQASYYVCSVANTLLLNPLGQIDWHGLASEPIFYKDLLAKFGIRMEVFKVGTYKSAVEPYTMTEMSDANRQQVTSYLQSIWSHMAGNVSRSRKIHPDSLQVYADRYITLAPGKQITQIKMADKLAYIDETRTLLKKAIHLNENEQLQIVSPAQLADIRQVNKPTQEDEIAVYYAYGDIVSTPLTGIGSNATICAPDVIQDLEELGNDEHIKAVVLRINSGGGSAYASEQIWRSIRLLSKKKPIVVSMGGMAASGAYYIACGANHLMALPTTLTGSIGIFGIIPDASELLTEKLNLHFDEVKTNEHATFGTQARPMNVTERHLMQQYINRGYDLFVKRVSEGRHIKAESVNKLAQGRVWTGTQAKENGLIDEIGTLEDAIKRAAKMGKTNTYDVVHYPKQKPWYELLLEEKGRNYIEGEVKQLLGDYYAPLRFLKSSTRQDFIQTRIPYLPNIH